MNESERTVHRYLVSLQIGEVIFEPDGNIPPDFLIAGRIAVEARRLNQNEEIDGSYRGLEVTSRPLHELVTKAIEESGSPPGSNSWFVMYTVWRPLAPWKELERKLRAAVGEFRGRLPNPPDEIRIDRSLRLRFFPASNRYETLLVLGGSTDHDSGGFVVAELIRNLRLCIAEKATKVAAVRPKYGEWWLAFEDRISYGALDDSDAAQLRAALGTSREFDKIVLVNPVSPTRAIIV